MNGLRTILETWHGTGYPHPDAVLATVVHVKGSAYRRPGARMLIFADGKRIGTISGGCLEGEVVKKAAWWTSNEPVALRSFDSSFEGAAWDFGLGCNGVISVLLERADASGIHRLFDFLRTQQVNREETVIATVIRVNENPPHRLGDRAWWDGREVAGGNLCNTRLAADLSAYIEQCFAERESRLVHLADADVFVEWIGPPQRLVLFGGGHDVLPLVKIANLMDWSVTVADGRTAYIGANRFPEADNTLVIPANGDISQVDIDRDTAVVMMTHNYPQDMLLLPQILAKKPRYFGILGSSLRTENLFADVNEDISKFENVYAPVGLDIGTDHPETIALSIVAEIQSVLAKRPAGSLRHRNAGIHDPVMEVGLTDKLGTYRDETVLAVCELSQSI